jgi:hypothetical protein
MLTKNSSFRWLTLALASLTLHCSLKIPSCPKVDSDATLSGANLMTDRNAPARMRCPACGTLSPTYPDRLGQALQCVSCAKRYRIHASGQLVEITSRTTGKTGLKVGMASAELPAHARFHPGARRLAGIVGATLVVLVAAWAMNPTSHHTPPSAELRTLPEDLTGRCEVMGRAWMARDFITIRRLTASERDMELRVWLARHPSPISDNEVPDTTCDVRVLQERGATAQISIRVQAPSGAQGEIRQSWVKEEERWVFLPPEGRLVRVAQLSRPGY